jgi:hypothetical protein
MVPGRRLYNEFNRRYRRINSSANSQLPVVDVCSFLTEAVHIYIGNLAKNVEENTEFKSILSPLEEKGKELEIVRVTSDSVIFKRPKDFFRKNIFWVKAEREGCGEKDLDVIFIRSNALQGALRDPLWEPSFQYEETIADESNEGFHVYYKPGDFKILSARMDYIKLHGPIDVPSVVSSDEEYRNYDGQIIKRDSNLLLTDPEAARTIVDIAVLISSRDTGSVQDFQTQLSKMMQF